VRTPFVGRPSQLAELVSAVDAAGLEDSVLALVTGEPGIGKTRLVREEAVRASTRVAPRVPWETCWEGEGAPADWPWVQVLRALVADGRVARPEAAGGRGGEQVPRLLEQLPSPEVLCLAQETRDRQLELLGRRLRLVAALKVGHVGQADVELERFAGVAEQLRQPLYPLPDLRRAPASWRSPRCRSATAIKRCYSSAVADRPPARADPRFGVAGGVGAARGGRHRRPGGRRDAPRAAAALRAPLLRRGIGGALLVGVRRHALEVGREPSGPPPDVEGSGADGSGAELSAGP
jgi:hypothetical protein